MFIQVDSYADWKTMVLALSGGNSRAIFHAPGGDMLYAFIGDKVIWMNPYTIQNDYGAGNPPTTLATDFPDFHTISFRPLFWLDTATTGLSGGPASW